MRKLMLLAALLAVLVVAALPALAQNRGGGDDRNNHKGGDHKGSDHKGGGYKGGGHNGGGEPAVAQENELEADSGEVDQSFTVTSEGSNGNQCVGINGTANTGNAQNTTGVLQYASEADDFEFDDSGAKLDVSGDSTTTCDQEVNQAASAG